MSVFDKVRVSIKNAPQNGHALVNAQNKKSLAKAKKEISKMMK